MKARTLLLSLAMFSAGLAAAADVDWWNPVSMAPSPNEVVTDVTELQDIRINYGSDWAFTVEGTATAHLMSLETFMPISTQDVTLWDFALENLGEYYLRVQFPEAVTSNGTYELTIDGNHLLHDGELNGPIRFTFTVNDRSLNQEEIPECEVLSITPEAGTALPTVGLPSEEGGREYIIDTNINKYVVYATAEWNDVTDPMSPEYLTMTYTNRESGNEEPVKFAKTDEIKMYEGHIYEMNVVLYDSYDMPRNEIGNITVKYVGSSEAYVYSDLKAIAVNPDPNNYVITDPENAKFTVIFDGPVEVDEWLSAIALGPMGSEPYESITSNEEKTEWHFVIPSTRFEDPSITCSVFAKDSEGRAVLGNEFMSQFQSGTDDLAGFMFTFDSDMSGVILNVTPAEGVVESLKTFTVSVPEGFVDMLPTWNAKPYLARGQETIYTFNLETDTDMTTTYGTAVMTLPEEVTEPGRYVLIIPSATFNCFNEFDQASANKQMILSYEIEGAPVEDVVFDIEPKSIKPEPGIVNELKDFIVSFTGVDGIALYDAFLIDANGNEIKTDVEYDMSWDNLEDYHINFAEAITEPGEYTLYIPQGTFGDLTYLENWATGHASKEIRVNYTIVMTGVDGINAEELQGDVYNAAGVLVIRNASADDVKALEKGLYIIGGKKVLVK